MDMIAAAGPFKHAGNQDVAAAQADAADRAKAGPLSAHAVDAAPDMHQAVLAAGEGWKGHGFYELPLNQPGRTNRADLRISGLVCTAGGFFPFLPARPAQANSGKLAD